MNFTKNSILLLLIVLVFSIPFKTYSQYWLYGAGSMSEDEALAVTKDNSGNIITTGYFGTIATFSTNTLVSSGASDIFLMKSNANGDVIWVVKAGGFGEDRGQSVKTDALGNIYVTGFFYGTATFGSQTITSAGSQDVFIAKYNSSGSLIWVVSAGGLGTDIANSLTIDIHGNITVTGQFIGASTFGTTSLTSLINPTSGLNVTNVFVAHYNNAGGFLWVKQGSSIEDCRGMSLAADINGNTFVTGEFSDTIQFDVIHNNNINNAIFVVKYDSLGNEKWFKRIGGSISNAAHEIVINNNQDVLLTGNAAGTLYFFETPNYLLTNSYSNQVFVAKYSNSGNLLWAVSDGSESELTSQAIALGANGEIFISGEFRCKFSEYADVFGQGTFNSIGYRDIFVTKFDANGQRLWMRNLGGKLDDYIHGIVINNNNPILAGGFRNCLVVTTAGNTVSNNAPTTLMPANQGLNYCSDSKYGDFIGLKSTGYNDIFLVNAIDLNREPYDYYKRYGTVCDRPYVGCCINHTGADSFCEDSVVVCSGAMLTAASNTSLFYSTQFSTGPNFDYHWSTGSSFRNIVASNSGDYYVTVTSSDGCFQSSDSIYVTVNAVPDVPWISDNLGVGVNSPEPYTIFSCGDSIVLTASNITGVAYFWTGPGFPGHSNTLSVHADLAGLYEFTVVGANGCQSSNNVGVEFGEPLEPIIPYLLDITDSVSNDTIFICDGSSFTIHAFDFITDPNNQIIDNPILISNIPDWTVDPIIPMVSGSLPHASFTPDTSGYYDIDYICNRSNRCYSDVASAYIRYYVQLMPVPSVSITAIGQNHICPGDSIWLSVCCASNYLWEAGAAFIGDSTADSILVFQPGSYSVSSTLTNSYGCAVTDMEVINVNSWGVPQIQMLPSNGLICPNGSVTLSTTAGYGLYEWYGPTGLVPSNLSSIVVSSAGYYFCIATMPDGCRISSNTVEVTQYVTPFLLATPNEVLCPGDSVMLTVVTNPGSTFAWQSPLSGYELTQVIHTPGYYSCQVFSCGITTNAGANVIASFPVAQITALGPVTFCNGDSVTLLGNSGMEVYIWHPGNTSDTVLTVHNSGDYYLVTSDLMGCDATSNIITVDVITVPGPVVVNDTICSGQTITLDAGVSSGVSWYDSPTSTTPIGTGQEFSTPNLTQTATYWVQSVVSGCESDMVPVVVTVIDSVLYLTPSVSSNSPVCAGDTIYLFSNVVTNANLHWNGPSGYNSFVQNPFISPSSVLSSGIYSLYVEQNGCLSNQASVQVIVNPLPGLFLSSDTTICNGDTISLFANGGSSIQWAPDYALSDPLSYNPACFPENSTLYTATVTDANTCTQTGNILVNVIDSNVVYVTNTMHIVVGENVQLNVTYNQGGSTILWSPADGLSCTTCPSPYAQPMETTEYTVMLMDTLGCFTSYGTVLIEVMEEYTMDVPSAFTPNGDGDNDIVYVRGWGLKKLIQFDIFNRWGELIFSSDDLNRGWDGTFKGVNQNIETYVYVAKAETYNGLILEKHGYIELLR